MTARISSIRPIHQQAKLSKIALASLAIIGLLMVVNGIFFASMQLPIPGYVLMGVGLLTIAFFVCKIIKHCKESVSLAKSNTKVLEKAESQLSGPELASSISTATSYSAEINCSAGSELFQDVALNVTSDSLSEKTREPSSRPATSPSHLTQAAMNQLDFALDLEGQSKLTGNPKDLFISAKSAKRTPPTPATSSFSKVSSAIAIETESALVSESSSAKRIFSVIDVFATLIDRPAQHRDLAKIHEAIQAQTIVICYMNEHQVKITAMTKDEAVYWAKEVSNIANKLLPSNPFKEIPFSSDDSFAAWCLSTLNTEGNSEQHPINYFFEKLDIQIGPTI